MVGESLGWLVAQATPYCVRLFVARSDEAYEPNQPIDGSTGN